MMKDYFILDVLDEFILGKNVSYPSNLAQCGKRLNILLNQALTVINQIVWKYEFSSQATLRSEYY